MHSQKYLFHQIVDEIYKNTLHKFETCMPSIHMRYKTNQIDDSIPFVQTHIEPMFAPSGPVRAPLAPDLRLCSAPCKVGACAHPFKLRQLSCFRGSGPLRPSFSPARIHIAHRPPPAPARNPVLPPSRTAPSIPPVRARIASLSSPPALLQSPRVRALRPKTHNTDPAQHDDDRTS